MPGMVYNPDLHPLKMKCKINKNIDLEDLCRTRPLDTPGHPCKNQQEKGMKSDPQKYLTYRNSSADAIKQHSKPEITEKLENVIGYREIFLSDEVRKDHHCTIAYKSRPRGSKITVYEMVGTQRDPPEIQGQRDSGTDYG
jgi:hypothetical protein